MPVLKGALFALMMGLSLILLASGCSNGGSAEPSTPAPTPTRVATTDGAPVTLKVLSFNLFYGAGYDRRFDEHISARFKGRDRMPELLAYLREADPDVLALEEAAGWDEGEPPVVAQVASELGMSYVLAPDAWELHIILMSKYPIVAADYVSRFQDFNGVALRATIQVTPRQNVNVIAAHLNSMSRQTRACQVDALLDMASALQGRTILLGDMNFRSNTDQAEVLRDAGWQLAAVAAWPIDQIWLDGSAPIRTGGWWEDLPAAADISDHLPIGAEIVFDAPLSPTPSTREPVTEPGVLDYACPLPS